MHLYSRCYLCYYQITMSLWVHVHSTVRTSIHMYTLIQNTSSLTLASMCYTSQFDGTDFVNNYLQNQWRQTLPHNTYWKDQYRARTPFTRPDNQYSETHSPRAEKKPRQNNVRPITSTSKTHLTHVTQQRITYSFLPLEIHHGPSVDAV